MASPTSPRISAEDTARLTEYAHSLGWPIVDVNVTWRDGVLPLIAYDPDAEALVFAGFGGPPPAAATSPEAAQLRKFARRWLVDHLRCVHLRERPVRTYRFDHISEDLSHERDAF